MSWARPCWAGPCWGVAVLRPGRHRGRVLSSNDIHHLVARVAVELRHAADHIEAHDPVAAQIKRSQASALDRLLPTPFESSAER